MGIASFTASILDGLQNVTKKPLSSFSFLETTDGEHTIVGKDGSLLSILRVDGIKQVMGDDELSAIINKMSISMASYLAETGHAIQFWFSRDPDLAPQIVKNNLRTPRKIAESLQLNLDDLFEERQRNLPNYIVHEGFYIALWTRLDSLTKPEQKKAKIDTTPPKYWPSMADAQDIFKPVKSLITRHKSFVTSFLSDIRNQSIRATLLNSHEAVKVIRWSIYPDLIDQDWKPTLVGDRTPARMPELHRNDASHLLWPTLDDQIFHQEAERINSRIIKIGSRYMAGVDMTVGPQEVMPFTTLLNRVINNGEIPWRVSFLLEGGAMSSLGIKAFMAGIFGFTNQENRAIKEAIKTLQERRVMHQETIAKLRISFATWAPANDLDLIEQRSTTLQRSVESWGNCGVSASAGDPVEGYISSTLGVFPGSTAPPGAVPLPEAIALLPWNRDSSPWKDGTIMFRTVDGRLWPYTPGSSLQDVNIDLIFAPPGKGKSVLMSTTSLALTLSPMSTQGTGGAKLARIAIIDIGMSSAGTISLIKEALPPNRRHEAQYMRLTMDRDHAINPFDTHLGCRRPFPTDRSFLINFLTAIGTEPDAKETPAGLSDIAGACVDELYELFSDRNPKGTPKKYIKNMDVIVDAAIKQHNIDTPQGCTWWYLVDELFKRKEIHAATLAQRFAVPLIDDLGSVIKMDKILKVFGTAISASTETTIDIFTRMYSAVLREYPILTAPTKFDTGNSRIVALDLDEVAPRGTGPARKQTAIMYMLARYVLAKDFYLNMELLTAKTRGEDLIPVQYKEYFTKEIYRIKETPKRLIYDEFHRTQGIRAVRDQVIVDMREGRKWGVQITLASQMLNDFDQEMVNMATAVWILGVGNQQNAKDTAEIFGLSPTAHNIINYNLNGPTASGAPFLAVLSLRDGKHEHLLYNTLGPIEMWAFSTTAVDTALRNRVYEKLPAAEARRRLAHRYPNGTARNEIERRIQIQMEQGVSASTAQDGIISDLVKEILDMKI